MVTNRCCSFLKKIVICVLVAVFFYSAINIDTRTGSDSAIARAQDVIEIDNSDDSSNSVRLSNLEEPEVNYICGLVEHIHGEGCYSTREVGYLDCPYEGSDTLHEHNELCYDDNGDLVCTLDDDITFNDEDGISIDIHRHDDNCIQYEIITDTGSTICELGEHTHTDECIPIGDPVCGIVAHSHENSCYDYIEGRVLCNKEAHRHTKECYSQGISTLMDSNDDSDGDISLQSEETYWIPLSVLIFGDEPSGEAIWVINDSYNTGDFEARTVYNQDVQLPFTGEDGVSQDIEITNDPNEENSAVYRDERIWHVNVTPHADGSVSINSQSFLMEDGYQVGVQDSFIIKVPLQNSLWSDEMKEKAHEVMDEMSIEEKVGQMFLIHWPGNRSGSAFEAKTLLDTYNPGGFIVFRQMFENSTPAEVRSKVNTVQKSARIPLMFSVDEEGGIVTRISRYSNFRSVGFPSQMAVASGGVNSVKLDAAEKAELLKSLGLTINHAPVADVSEEGGMIYARTYGLDGVGNSPFVAEAIKGHQENNIGITMKHFPGYGSTTSDTHNGFAVNDLTLADFEYNDLIPFYAGIGAGGRGVMVTHNIINALDTENPASLSPEVIGYLRNTMNYDGIVMTDDLEMGAVTDAVGEGQASLSAIKAGADVALTSKFQDDIPVVINAVKSGEITEARIDESVERILCWKMTMGLDVEINDKDPDAPEGSNTRWENGTETQYGSFTDMWNLAQSRGGVITLLEDVNVTGNLEVTNHIGLNLRGNNLHFQNANNTKPLININSGYVLDIYDSKNLVVNEDGTVSGDSIKPKVTSGSNTQTSGYNKDTRVLKWKEMYSDESINYFTADFSQLGLIDSDVGDEVFYVYGTLNFNGGVISHYKKGIHARYGHINIKGGNILGCGSGYSSNIGGGMYVEYGTIVSIEESYIAGNTAIQAGGGIFVSGAGGAANVTINGKDVVIALNKVTQYYNGVYGGGGGITTNNGGILNLIKGRVAENTSASFGGGIEVSNRGTATIGNQNASNTDGIGEVLITGNKADLGGAGISIKNTGSTATISGAAITWNDTTGSGANGGGILNGETNTSESYHGGNLTVKHSVIKRNRSLAGCGGGVSFFQTSVSNKIVDTIVTNNSAQSNGGGMHLPSNMNNNVNVGGNTIIENNTADGEGNNLYLGNKDVLAIASEGIGDNFSVHFVPEVYPMPTAKLSVATGVTTEDNSKKFILDTKNNEYGVDYDSSKTLVYLGLWEDIENGYEEIPAGANAKWENGTGIPTYGTFEAMWVKAQTSGGVVTLVADVTSSGTLTVSRKMGLNLNGYTLSQTNIPSNTAGIIVSPTGILDIYDVKKAVVGTNGSVTGKEIKPTIVKLYTSGSRSYNKTTKVLTWSEMYSDGNTLLCKADFSSLGSIEGDSGDGGIYVNGGTLNLYGGVVTHNSKGIHTYSNGTLNIDGGNVLGCGKVAKKDVGGGIRSEDSTIKITEGYIGGNTVNKKGGGIYLLNSQLTINGIDAVIAANDTYYAWADSDFGGGGIFAGNSSITLQKGRVADNQGGAFGGGIALYGGSTAIIGSTSNSSVDDALVTKNECWMGGGGINIHGNASVLKIKKAAITGNQQTGSGNVGDGAGIQNGSTPLNNYFIAAEYKGGTLEVENSVVTKNNTRSTKGGGVYIAPSSIKTSIVDTEVTYNESISGGGIYLPDNKVVYTGGDTVIKENTSRGLNSNVYLGIGSTFQITENGITDKFEVHFSPVEYPTETSKVNVAKGVTSRDFAKRFKLDEQADKYEVMWNQVDTAYLDFKSVEKVEFDGVLVQYFGHIRSLSQTGDSDRMLGIIDTSGGQLPRNRGAIREMGLYLSEDGTVKYDYTYQEMYRAKDIPATNIGWAKDLLGKKGYGDNYGKYKVWVGKSDELSVSYNEEDGWDVYDYKDRLKFTSNLSEAQEFKDTIYIEDGYVIRFVGEPLANTKDLKTAFWDYDVTDGFVYTNNVQSDNDAASVNRTEVNKVFDSNGNITNEMKNFLNTKGNGSDMFIYTDQQGINSTSNYRGESGTKLAFGTLNLQNGIGNGEWYDEYGAYVALNRYNNLNYKGCAFGIVKNVVDGKLIYSDGIVAPYIFNEAPMGAATPRGKTKYDNGEYSLRFITYGDTFTLTSVVDKKGEETVRHLENFENIWESANVNNPVPIWSNSFWPMDYTPSYGTVGHDVKMGAEKYGQDGDSGYGMYIYKDPTGGNNQFVPLSDDGLLHNSFFSMHFEIKFTVPEDYIGPMNYMFFGDDDMWVFLIDEEGNSQLICDIGGIHSSVGEYVNLWDYIPKDKEGKYKLSFYYTERGASGSTCWMTFRLPDIAPISNTGDPTGVLKIQKNVDGDKNIPNEKFKFKVDIEDGSSGTIEYRYAGSAIGVLKSGDIIELDDGEYAEIYDIPIGTEYKVIEVDAVGYDTTYPDNYKGTIMQDEEEVIIVNKQAEGIVLPETGGTGWNYNIMIGVILLVAFAVIWNVYKVKCKDAR